LFHISAIAQLSWYKCLSGKIDKYPVTIHLHKWSHKYSGYYYYNNTQQPIYFFGDDTTVAGKIKLNAVLPDRETQETLTFAIQGNSCTGNWMNTAGRNLSFSANQVTQTPSWDFVFTTGAVKLKPQLQNSPVATYEAASVWPQGNSNQSVSLKQVINEWHAKESSTTDIGQIFLKEKKRFFDCYLSENKNIPDSDLVDTYSFNADETQTINLVFQSAELLTLAGLVYSYTGGAHGNYGTNYLSIDLLHNKKLSLDDVLSASGQKQLGRLLGKYFRKNNNLKDTDALSKGGLFEDEIKPNNNFFVTGKGLAFDYSPYEIGPYAMGEIIIFIPFTELSAYLQSDFKKLVSN